MLCVCVCLELFCSNCACGFMWVRLSEEQLMPELTSRRAPPRSKPRVGTSIIAWHRERSMKQQLETLTCPLWAVESELLQILIHKTQSLHTHAQITHFILKTLFCKHVIWNISLMTSQLLFILHFYNFECIFCLFFVGITSPELWQIILHIDFNFLSIRNGSWSLRIPHV